MFSFFGHKKKDKSPPGERDQDHENAGQPPIPAATDDFVVINNRPNNPYPYQPGLSPMHYPALNVADSSATNFTKKEVNFLQGVPFSLNKDFSSNNRNDILALQLSEIMAYCTRRLNLQTPEYEFTIEKSVLREEDS